ncbi:hypothetical protein V1264_005556 [Littorina saxatilis]|uniref:Uncharacterized protein n=1 Tax=Littorina saxatilis TaxID=31220 RepID=A0AAN9B023_9CAEN
MNTSMLLSLLLLMTLLTTGLTAVMPEQRRKDESRRDAPALELSAHMRSPNLMAPAKRQALGCYCYNVFGMSLCSDTTLDDAGNIVTTDVASC